jgi:hypothetical protein
VLKSVPSIPLPSWVQTGEGEEAEGGVLSHPDTVN